MSRVRHPRGAQIAALTPIVRRLHMQELQRVRRDAARLAQYTEDYAELRRQLEWAEDRADHWHDNVMQLLGDGSGHGITQDGRIVAIDQEDAS